MRIYVDCLEMMKEVERDLFEMGIKVESATVQDKKLSGEASKTMELNGYVYKLTSFNKMDEMLDYMEINKEWVRVEFEERISSELHNPGKAWELCEGLWGKYIHDGKFEYTYSERIRDQLPYVIDELKNKPNTRQAILTIYDQHKDMRNWGGKARVPCSLSYQFVRRNDELHLLYNMRSCDLLKHFASDVAFSLKLLGYIAGEIDTKIGTFTHFIGSLHAFQLDINERGIF
jgi:thymidylate synthase